MSGAPVVGKFREGQQPSEVAVNDFLATLQQGGIAVDQNALLAQALGFVAWNQDPSVAAQTGTPTQGTIYASGINLPGGATISNIGFLPSTAGVGTAPTGMYVGLVDPSGYLRAVSTNRNNDAAWKSTAGFTNTPLSAPFTVSVNEAGLYYAVLLQVGAFGTTQPIFKRSYTWGGQGPSGVLQYGTLGTGQSALPAVGSQVTISSGGSPLPFLVAVS